MNGGMQIFNPWNGAAEVAQVLKNTVSNNQRIWSLRWTPVCSSTEIGLTKWLIDKPLEDQTPRALLAARQNKAFGQHGRIWESPRGGVWISSAIPFSETYISPALIGLSVAATLSEKLEVNKVPVYIKWPNDLMVGDRKLLGILPRVISRGNKIRLIRVGVGLNVFNKVPKGAISLHEIIFANKNTLAYWSAQVLVALDLAINKLNNPDWIIHQVERRLWSNQIIDSRNGENWKIEKINLDGSIVLSKGGKSKTLTNNLDLGC